MYISNVCFAMMNHCKYEAPRVDEGDGRAELQSVPMR